MSRFLAGLCLLVGMATAQATAAEDGKAVAIFAGGCFWCVEADFDKVPGVLRTVSGYTGGHVAKPTYRQVVGGDTGHREAVHITYDPMKVSYETLLDVFWHSVDPTDEGGQFCDRGMSYTTAIYTTTPEQKRLAEISKAAVDEAGTLDDPVATPIVEAGTFYPAEEQHQDYYTKNPFHYRFYRARCGRDGRIRDLWGSTAFRGMTKK